MDIGEVLRNILIVLVAAKLAAEVAERLNIPAVVGEIVAGVIIGPSMLGLVAGDDVLQTLGEIGVILLLLEVGMEMDLDELRTVGRSSLLVAIVGVIAPMALGIGLMQLVTDDFDVALFVGAALAATSVGVTARVFGDLRALATVEARTVLGAAVADDVIGLVVLTVVVRTVTTGSLSIVAVGGIILAAVAFLVIGAAVALRIAQPLFGFVDRAARSTGTLVCLALAFTLAFSELADAARLAPIVGVFLAGIVLGRSDQAHRVRRELAPVGHLFIPVFFLQIGIHADVASFGDVEVLRIAGLLMVAAVVGKLISPIGAMGRSGDSVLIGFGMLPRGEVGLIFATIGLEAGVLDADLYAALLLVVLLTTLLTPQLLKMRYDALRKRAQPLHGEGAEMPPGGWLTISGGVVELAATPPRSDALRVGLEAAIRIGWNRPGDRLLSWVSQLPDEGLEWTPAARDELFALVERGNARSWRFVDTSGILQRALPELGAAMDRRRDGGFTLDPLEHHRFGALDRLRRLNPGDPIAVELEQLREPDLTYLAALLAEALDTEPDAAGIARAVVRRLELPPPAESFVARLVEDRELLWAGALATAGLSEPSVLNLAAHLAEPDRARALYVLTSLRAEDVERWQLDRLRELHERIQATLAAVADDDGAATVVDRRRAEVVRLVNGNDQVRARVLDAPRSYLLRENPSSMARQLTVLGRLPAPTDVVVRIEEHEDGRTIDVGVLDRPGLLATVTGALSALGLEIDRAVAATWPDGAVLESFRVTGPPVASDDITRAIAERFGTALSGSPLPDAEVTFDQAASPWHTICEVVTEDRLGTLHDLATAFAAADVVVNNATASTHEGKAYDRFELARENGSKLDAADEARVRAFVLGGVMSRSRRFRRSQVSVAAG